MTTVLVWLFAKNHRNINHSLLLPTIRRLRYNASKGKDTTLLVLKIKEFYHAHQELHKITNIKTISHLFCMNQQTFVNNKTICDIVLTFKNDIQRITIPLETRWSLFTRCFQSHLLQHKMYGMLHESDEYMISSSGCRKWQYEWAMNILDNWVPYSILMWSLQMYIKVNFNMWHLCVPIPMNYFCFLNLHSSFNKAMMCLIWSNHKTA